MKGTELRGPSATRHRVAEFCRLWLPAHVDAAVAAWDLEPEALPVPVSAPGSARDDAYLDREPSAIDRWPLLAVTSGRRTSRQVDQTEDGEVQVASVLPVRVYTWVRAQGWDATIAMRDNLATVVQVMFLAHNNLDGDGDVRVMPSTILTDYSTVEKVGGDRVVAGSYVGFDLTVVETLTDRLALPGAPVRDRVARVKVDADRPMGTP